MAWNCKPSGAYALTSNEGVENMNEYYSYMSAYTTKNNVVGQLCNVFAESGLNPWRWQSDTYDPSNGYGLYQYTPGHNYTDLTGVPGHSPNMSTSQVLGGSPTDATAQMYVFANNILSKWTTRCWRKYWNVGETWDGPPKYPDLWDIHTHILNTYGDGSTISLSQFFSIDDISDACFCFLACFEGPQVPNFAQRMSYAQTISDAIGGGPEPPEPIDIMDIVLYGKKNKSIGYNIRAWRL